MESKRRHLKIPGGGTPYGQFLAVLTALLLEKSNPALPKKRNQNLRCLSFFPLFHQNLENPPPKAMLLTLTRPSVDAKIAGEPVPMLVPRSTRTRFPCNLFIDYASGHTAFSPVSPAVIHLVCAPRHSSFLHALGLFARIKAGTRT